MRTISLAALRRLVVTTQGYVPRVRRAGVDEVEAAIRRASCIQLDTISTVERSHRIAISSRAGLYPPGTVPELLREGRIIEGWVHALCVLPAEDWPLHAWARECMCEASPLARRRQDAIPGAGGARAR